MARQTVLITGANRGLGLSLVRAYLGENYAVLAGIRNSRGGLDAVDKDLRERLEIVTMDVTDETSVARAIEQADRIAGSLDILVNNAAILLDKDIPLEELDLSLVERTMAANTVGPLRVTQRCLPLLEKGKGKTVVNISSEAGSIGDCRRDCWYGYCMSKAALNMQSRILDNALSPRGYRVMAVHPGWLKTDMGGPDAVEDPDEIAGKIVRLSTGRTPRESVFVNPNGTALHY